MVNIEQLSLFTDALGSGMMDFQRLTNLAHLVMRTEDIPGDIVEFGCNKGITAAFIASLTKKKLHLYDSFDGLPEPKENDRPADGHAFLRGKFSCTREDCAKTIANAGFQNRVAICQRWFNELTSSDLPETISFAHIDADLYESTYQALELIYRRMRFGGIIVFDDYSWPGLPGVQKAVDTWLYERACVTPRDRVKHPKMLGHEARAHQAWIIKK